jgi:hypothetical protein
MQNFLKDDFPPIPIRIKPSPWEDIASLLSRIAEQMGYANPRWLLSPEISQHTLRALGVSTLHRAADYRFLEHLLMMDEEALYACTLHRFSAKLQEGRRASFPRGTQDVERPLLPQVRGTVGPFFHNPLATKVCPQCLSEGEAYGRLYWHIRPVTVCLRHSIMLLNICPDCYKSIPLLRPSLTHCPYCKGDYRAAHSAPIYEDSYFLAGQNLILCQLGIEDTLQEDALCIFSHTPLLDIAPGQYFRLLEAFRNILFPFFPDYPFLRVSSNLRPLLHKLSQASDEWTPLEWAVLTATFHFIFASWPANYYTFLDTLSSIKAERFGGTGVIRHFGLFYDRWLYHRLHEPDFSFLREGFKEYLLKYYSEGNVSRKLLPFRGMPISERPYLTLQQASCLLGVRSEIVEALIAQGKILVEKSFVSKNGTRYHCLVLRKNVEAVRDELKTFLPLQTVARVLLGISPERVLTLADAGFLVPVRGPRIDGSTLWIYKDADVEEFISRVVNCASSGSLINEKGLPLCQVMHRLGKGFTMARVLAEVLSGRLKPVDTGDNCPLLHRLKLPDQEIARFIESLHKQRREELALLTSSETASYLHTSVDWVLLLASAGLLEYEQVMHGERVYHFFRLHTVETFRTSYIFSGAAAAMLHVSSRVIGQLVADGVLSPALDEVKRGTRYRLFLREDINDRLSTIYRHDSSAGQPSGNCPET